MKHAHGILIAAALGAAGFVSVAAAGESAAADLNPVAARLEAALAELSTLRETIAEEKLPLTRALHQREGEHVSARQEHETLRRQIDRKAIDRSNQDRELRRLENEQAYLSNLFAEYARNFETRLHIAEMRNFETVLTAAKAAHEQTDLPPARRFVRQLLLVEGALKRIEENMGGTTFEGRAAGEDGIVVPGRFALVGPLAFFSAAAAPLAGVAEQRLGSLEPTVAGFANPAFVSMTRDFVAEGEGLIPFDASLGNARKIEATRETLGEHIRKGGPVMIPILSMAGLVALLALAKGLSLGFVKMPTAARMAPLLDAVRRGDRAGATAAAAALDGPAGDMLSAGANHLGGSKDLIEETMYERMLETRFRLNRGLPFIAVAAATAPLLGLLGTVTGIISTFKLITVFGTGDVKMLSSGISEALITTEFGLIVAIPSLLMHAFLSRKARALLDRMEQLAVSFLGAAAGGPIAGMDCGAETDTPATLLLADNPAASGAAGAEAT